MLKQTDIKVKLKMKNHSRFHMLVEKKDISHGQNIRIGTLKVPVGTLLS